MIYEAGADLDTEISVRIFQTDRERFCSDEPGYLHVDADPRYSVQLVCPTHLQPLWRVPRYSTDMGSAWLVVEEITNIRRTEHGDNTRFMLWWRQAELWAMDAAEAAEEICRAALKAVEQG